MEAGEALFDAVRVTFMVYFFVVLPSCAVTTVVMVVVPKFKDIACEAVPEPTAMPFTVTIDVESLAIGVNVTDDTVSATLAVYPAVVGVNTGDKVPLLMARPASEALVDAALVMVMTTVLVVTPSCAVSAVVITVGPTGRAIAADAVPDVTGCPLTVMPAVASFAVGTTCMLLIALGTAAIKFRLPGPAVTNNDVAGSVVIEANCALLDGTRVTFVVYVLVVWPSCAVTVVVMMLSPKFKGILCDVVPEVTALPFTVTVAAGSIVVGVTAIDVTSLVTLAP